MLAKRLGRGLYEGQYTVVRTSIPTSAINPTMQATVDRGISTVTVPTALLSQLSPANPLTSRHYLADRRKMARQPDIIASVRFYHSEQGGRKGPTPSHVFRCPLEFEGEKFDCGLHLEELGALAPGMTATVPITLLSPAMVKHRLKVGSRFKLWELGEIADGVVVKVIFD